MANPTVKMAFRNLRFSLKAFRFRRLLMGGGDGRKNKMNPSWLTPVSHGCYTVDRFSGSCSGNLSDSDMVLVQREQSEELEIWLFGVSDTQTRDVIAKYMQTHLFDKLRHELGVARKSKEITRRAYMSAVGGQEKEERIINGGLGASVMVVNGEELTMASMGGYRVVVCREGDAHQIRKKKLKSSKRHWSKMIFPACNQRQTGEEEDGSETADSELAVVMERISPDTEFIIIGSSGIWEVMKNQEAVNLIRHIEDPKQAAKCLAEEALNRMSKGAISCIVIRFD
ncbi:PREDICTED: putative protein phosphatase 2C-like protein 44 isoform X1 [Tarenaya hassleriana]|uniref:putative protein phosphatase 2C-like protein 44 isoform X1 n=1 Tax=Tarenaya hassleriana TaxID=28532 RepID=UPI00053C81EE|nr:PREDICTED: putative protein phosphatase 2C-like protein 44 isoform X1 [Tarenaya hassleriana]